MDEFVDVTRNQRPVRFFAEEHAMDHAIAVEAAVELKHQYIGLNGRDQLVPSQMVSLSRSRRMEGIAPVPQVLPAGELFGYAAR